MCNRVTYMEVTHTENQFVETEDWYRSDINTYQTNDFVSLHKATDEVKIVKTCTFEKVRDQLEQAVGGLQSAGV